MGGTEWRRTRTAPVVFAGTALAVLLTSVVLVTEIRGGALTWVLGAALGLSGVAALVSTVALPTRVAFDERGVRLRYLRRREGLMWEQILHVHVVEGSVLLETSHRTIDLGSLGGTLRRDLVREARRRGRKVRTDTPEDYVEPPLPEGPCGF